MRKKKTKSHSREKSDSSAKYGKVPKNGLLDALFVGGWIGWVQNASVALVVVITAIICTIMKMSVLKTSVITACVLITALVWVIGLATIRAYDLSGENQPFAVAIETTYSGLKRDTTQLFCEYNQRFLSPVPIAMFLRIVNTQDIPAKISLLRIEVALKRRKWLPDTWLEAERVPEYMPLLWVSGPPASARRITLVGPQLMPILERPIAPHDTVSGWILFDVSSEYDTGTRAVVFRITIKDTAGQTFSTIDDGRPSGDNIAAPERGFSTHEAVDITGYSIKHLADPPN